MIVQHYKVKIRSAHNQEVIAINCSFKRAHEFVSARSNRVGVSRNGWLRQSVSLMLAFIEFRYS